MDCVSLSETAQSLAIEPRKSYLGSDFKWIFCDYVNNLTDFDVKPINLQCITELSTSPLDKFLPNLRGSPHATLKPLNTSP